MLIKPKKSLGQNFLTDKNILQKISNTVKINEDTEILEIGPGTGNLTEYLLKKKPKKITLVEKDTNLSKLLKSKFGENIHIINEDFLNFSKYNSLGKNLIIFGNLPFNISSQILVKLIINKDKLKFQKIVFMFQKELADRILSTQNSKNYGRLTILTNWKFKIDRIIDISPNSFYPKPKVNSSLLLLTPKKKIFQFKKPENLEYITRVFFNQRRKKIKKPFNQLFNNANQIAEGLNIDLNLRPQNLNHQDYYSIAKELEKLRN